MVCETDLQPSNLIYPLFVRSGRDIKRPIESMPGQYQLSVDMAVQEARAAAALGIAAVILFGIPDIKDPYGSENYHPDGIIPRAARAIKDAVPEILVISDMCFCEYTDHGHCGVLNLPGQAHYTPYQPVGYLLNDPTLELLGQAAVIHAEAGVDMIAPSGMIDGMVGAIRAALDDANLSHIPIMSYAVKYASAFYGPFRHAAESTPSFGNRAQYQMYPGNRREALREAALDVAEGADIVMVKPALAYLDVIADIRCACQLPLAAYQVSGEYAMLHAAAANGWLDLRRSAIESLLSIKRAGADIILTYFALDAARWLRDEAGE
jgi:porphobilinogen synthase